MSLNQLETPRLKAAQLIDAESDKLEPIKITESQISEVPEAAVLSDYADYARSNLPTIVTEALVRLEDESKLGILGEKLKVEIVASTVLDMLFGPEEGEI